MIDATAQDFADLFDCDNTNPVIAMKVMEALTREHPKTDIWLMLLASISNALTVAIDDDNPEQGRAGDGLTLGLEYLMDLAFRRSSAHEKCRNGFIKQLLAVPKPRRKQGGDA